MFCSLSGNSKLSAQQLFHDYFYARTQHKRLKFNIFPHLNISAARPFLRLPGDSDKASTRINFSRDEWGSFNMQNESSRPILSAVFVDYDNVYLSLKRKNEEAAKRFAKDAASWIQAIASGEIITPTNAFGGNVERRLVMNRCYGNPVPRRNQADNSTDMNSFAFVRHHFLRSGFEIIDCPPLTAQLKNSSDIRMVMDVRDYLDHKTNFDEFIILSSDADFTPVLHRLRSHAKRTVIFANDNTVAPYTALSDGEVREADLIEYLIGGKIGAEVKTALPAGEDAATVRGQIIDQVVQAVLEADTPLPLEALADRAIRALGHDKTAGANWADAGSFRDLLIAELPDSIKLTGEPPYLAYEASRAIPQQPAPTPQPQLQSSPVPTAPVPAPTPAPAPAATGLDAGVAVAQVAQPEAVAATLAQAPAPVASPAPQQQIQEPVAPVAPVAPIAQPAAAAPMPVEQPQAQPVAEQQPAQTIAAGDLQQSISRIHEASQAPPFSPPEYRALFSIMAQEISENQLQGVKTLQNVITRAGSLGLDVKQDDARYVLDAISEADPWFENGASASLFASRFRNFVVSKCRDHGLNLSAAELDLIDAWFAGSPIADQGDTVQAATEPQPQQAPAAIPQQAEAVPAQDMTAGGRLDWLQPTAALAAQQSVQPQQPLATAVTQPVQAAPAPAAQPVAAGEPVANEEDFPRIVRNRLRG